MWFLRQWIRKNMPPVREEVARKWKTNLSLLYVVLAWNVTGLAFYAFINKQLPKSDDKTINYAKALGVTNAKVVQVSGLSKVGEYYVNLEDEEVDEFGNKKKQ